MKKQLFLIGLIFTMFVAYSQTTDVKSETQPTAAADTVAEPNDDFCPHRILFRFGGGYANNSFRDFKKEIDGLTRCSYSAMAEIGYTYFFHRNVGIGIGVGINYAVRSLKVNENRMLPGVDDPIYYTGDLYDLTYTAQGLKQRMGIWAVEIPLTVQFEKRFGRNGIYAGVGVKGYIPISTKVGFAEGVIDIEKIYDKKLNVTYIKGVDYHMNSIDLEGQSVKAKMRPSIDVLGEFGGIIGLSRSTDFYIGVYGSYGFLSILPKDGKIDMSDLNITDGRLAVLSDRYVNSSNKNKSGVEKWNLLQVGLKLGFHFLPCKGNSNKEYMRDAKRRYMDEMIKKREEPIIVTNTVQEFYYYIVPQIADDLLDEADDSKKKALMDLAQSLSMIKILFDWDSDIPKLSERNKQDIAKATEILVANPDLKIIVTGYTSPEGTVTHNQDLAQRRANAVRAIFIDKGVPKDQIATAAFTAEDPQHKIDIPEKEWPEQRAVIFRIEKK